MLFPFSLRKQGIGDSPPSTFVEQESDSFLKAVQSQEQVKIKGF